MSSIASSAKSASSLFRPRRVAQAIGGVFCWLNQESLSIQVPRNQVPVPGNQMIARFLNAQSQRVPAKRGKFRLR